MEMFHSQCLWEQQNIARQSGWERRVNQDERQRPRGMIAAGGQNGKSDCVATV
jgi:hypothetical protein